MLVSHLEEKYIIEPLDTTICTFLYAGLECCLNTAFPTINRKINVNIKSYLTRVKMKLRSNPNAIVSSVLFTATFMTASMRYSLRFYFLMRLPQVYNDTALRT